MAKLSAAAVIRSIRQLASLDIPSKRRAALEAFLVAKRLSVVGAAVTINEVNVLVGAIFNVLPDHPRGRIQPFDRNHEAAGVAPKWGLREGSGRMTVWNMTTRGQPNLASSLFTGGDIRSGLLPNAADVLGQLLTPKPSIDALKVFLLRDDEFAGMPTAAQLNARLTEKFGIASDELARFTAPEPSLGVPLGGEPEWASTLLPVDLSPASGPDVTVAVPVIPVEAELIVDERVRRMVRLAIASSRAVLLVGPPGTGKTALLHETIEDIRSSPTSYGFSQPIGAPLWQTPEESWSTRDLLGGETLVAGGTLRFRPGFVLDAIGQNRWVVLDEANRADMDKIFGGMLTWLSGRSVKLGRASTDMDSPPIEIGWNRGQPECVTSGTEGLAGAQVTMVSYLAGDDWRLLGTYNAVDAQRVFRFGQALGRRFARVPIPPMQPAQFTQLVESEGADLPEQARRAVREAYAAHYTSLQQLGPALFLGVLAYIRAGVGNASGGTIEPPDGTAVPNGPAGALTRLIAEGYLVHLGTWLARLEPKELAELEQKLVTEAAVIPQAEWQWLTQMLPSLA
jgi:MoxR-like ATPase